MSERVSSWHVAVAAEAFAAAIFARCGLDVSVQYGADQPEYDLIVGKGERLLKVSVKGSQNGAWGLAQSYLQNADYHTAVDLWLKRHKPRTVLCFVQFKDVPLDRLPRVYLATPAEVAQRLHDTAGGKGGCVLQESHTWTQRSRSPGIADQIPETWRFRPERVEELLDRA
jgi:Holliday junction resolvase-like predicted endonuclease